MFASSFGRLIFLLALAEILSGFLAISTMAQTRGTIEFMDPETVYSFKGIDGKGFLRRSPVNLPQPLYSGNETGIVALIFEINPNGLVSHIRQESDLVTSANQEMIDASRTAVEQWKFNPLPPDADQVPEAVRVVIQFNRPNSGVIYSLDGRFTIEGLRDNRRPVRLAEPLLEGSREGVVTVMMTIEPTGGIAWIDRFYGAYPAQQVIPKLGIATNEAVRRWRFTPLPEDAEQSDQLLKVVCRYIEWKE